MKENVKFRWLGVNEYDLVAEIFKREDWAMPDPRQAAILIGEANGRVVACNTIQTIVHIGPAWIDPEHRHQGLWLAPMEELKGRLEGYGHNGVMLVAMNPATERIAEFLGMQRSAGVLYLKDFATAGGE